MSKWLRFNRADDLVWVTDPEGVPRALTRKQLATYTAVRSIAGTGQRVTLRALADQLGTAPSTVWRAVVKLTAMGFIAYQSNRGRLGGSMFLLRESRDGLDWCRDAAKAMIRKWWKASEDRISRLRLNVASCFPGRERELYQHRYITDTDTVIGRNIYPEWTPEDFREAGLM
jgi:DNA-binding MarR family transcriptional regulator